MSLDQKTNRRLVVGGLALAAVAGVAYKFVGARPGLTSLDAGTMATAGTLTGNAILADGQVLEMALGAEDAPVTVIEYASFTCPHCQRFHMEVFPKIRENFIETGKVRFILREVYFDRPGLWAAMVARCAGQERYFGIVDLLFEKQAEWSRAEDSTVLMQSLYSIGRQAGMTNEQMEACVRDEDAAKALVADFQTNTERDQITGTPSFLINGEKSGNVAYEQFVALINAKLGG